MFLSEKFLVKLRLCFWPFILIAGLIGRIKLSILFLSYLTQMNMESTPNRC